jgi:hypothetical protein
LGKLKGRRFLGKPRLKWVNNVEMGLLKVG